MSTADLATLGCVVACLLPIMMGIALFAGARAGSR